MTEYDAFVNLHVHTDMGSTLDGMGTPEGYAIRAAELGQPAVSITDHGTLFAAYNFQDACRRHGVTPIIGIEAYLAPEGKDVRERLDWGTVTEGGRPKILPGAYTHTTLLSTSGTGLRNLYRLHEVSYGDGYYYHPRVDLADLSGHADGVVATTGCLGGYVASRIRLGQIKEAEQHAAQLKDIFGERAFIEVMSHGIEEEDSVVTPALIDMSKRLGIPLLATGDCHYVNREDAGTHDAMLCIGTGSLISDENRFRFSEPRFHLPSRQEMEALQLPKEALDNTLLVAEMNEGYSGMFDYRLRMPTADLDGFPDTSTKLRWDAELGLARKGLTTLAYRDRLNYELSVIERFHYEDYFLVFQDLVEFAHQNGVSVGPGRGSAGGSLLAFSLGITGIDPVAHGLLFERFLNPDRVSLPDIDVDFEPARRHEVVEYAQRKYGADRVARIITFSTIAAKRALLDANRVMGGAVSAGRELVGLLPPDKSGRPAALSEGAWGGLEESAVHVLDVARGLEGLTRGTGVHASGLVISPEPLNECMPMWAARNELIPITGFGNPNTFPVIDKLGFVKFDILGLSALDTINKTIELIGHDVPLPTSETECTDARTFRLLSKGDSLGVFQMDSPGMRGLLRSVAPGKLGDIAAVVALFRPGPMGVGAHTEYAHRKEGRAKIEYPHPEFAVSLADTLGDTYGLIVFQEQVLAVLNVVCGWSYSEAGLLFDAMRKKLTEKMEASRPAFFEAALSSGYSQEAVDTLWETLVPFADYSFGKAHSYGYAVVAYWTAYLKANYPAEFFCALLTGEDDPKKQQQYIRDAQQLGLRILGPDVNKSLASWTPEEKGVRYGLESIRGCGGSAAQTLLLGRPYRDVAGLLLSGGVQNSGVLIALAKAGVLDSLHPDRNALVEHGAELVGRAALYRMARAAGQPSLVRPELVSPASLAHEGECADLYREWEIETLGAALYSPRLLVLLSEPLTETQWMLFWSILRASPGSSEVDLSFRGSKIGCDFAVEDNPQLRAALAKLPGVTL